MRQPPKGSGLYIITLQSGEQKYQSKLWNPILKRIAKKKTWQSTHYGEVIQQHYAFKQQYQDNNYEIIKEISTPTKELPSLLIQCAAFYEKYLKDDPAIVPEHKAAHRGERYIEYEIKYIKTFINCIKSKGINPSLINISAIDDRSVAIFYNYLEKRFKAEEIGAVTWNKHMKACTKWFNCLVEHEIVLMNPFKGVKLKTERTDPEFVELHELDGLLDIITPDNAISYRGKEDHTVNNYRPWLKTYILTSVFIGGRPDQMVNLRWRDWQGDYIIMDNGKVNRLKNEKGNKVYIYVHPELAELLSMLSPQSLSENDYVLVPEWKNRAILKNFVSRAFKHYWRQIGSEKDISLNNLRHTYINAVLNVIGEEGINIHNRKETAIKHYLSKKKRLTLEQGKTLFNINVKASI
jgi:integrase